MSIVISFWGEYMKIYTTVSKLAKEQGFTIQSIEKACGLGNGTVRKWDERFPSIDKLVKVSQLLRVPVGELIDEEYEEDEEIKLQNMNEKLLLDIYRSLSAEQKLDHVQIGRAHV